MPCGRYTCAVQWHIVLDSAFCQIILVFVIKLFKSTSFTIEGVLSWRVFFSGGRVRQTLESLGPYYSLANRLITLRRRQSTRASWAQKPIILSGTRGAIHREHLRCLFNAVFWKRCKCRKFLHYISHLLPDMRQISDCIVYSNNGSFKDNGDQL